MFLKIFLWFWLAIALVAGALTLVTWTLQDEPLLNRWQSGIGDALNVYAATAAQIADGEGENGLRDFLRRLESSNEIKQACVTGKEKTNSCFSELDGRHAQAAVEKAFLSDAVEFEFLSPAENYAARKFTTQKGADLVLAIQIQKPKLPPFLVDGRTRLLRILAVILTAGLLCYWLARYFSAPLAELRRATKQFAAGNLSVRVFPLIGKRRNEISGLAEDFDDMAERIENLVAAQKNLTADISHELRSPLARLGVALEIARTKTGAEAHPALDRIEREASRLNDMISQMLLLSKLETGTQNIEKSIVDLAGLVVETAGDADFEASRHHKTVKIVKTEQCVVRGESRLLRSAIENVMRNAVRYAPEHTIIEVTLTKENGTAVIGIRDYGAGVPPEELENLFRPFFRVGFARERNAGGAGLGLAITERAAHAHGGKVTAQNVQPHGLLVIIELPVYD